MKTLYTSLIILTALQIVSSADADKKIKMEGITSVEQMIGYLNKPFGSIVNVKGQVKLVPPIKGQRKAPQVRYFVVTHIEGSQLEKAVTFDLWSRSLPDAKHGEVVAAKAYERLMMLGTPKAAKTGMSFQSTERQSRFGLYRYIHILPEK